jgi:hypothetical protein
MGRGPYIGPCLEYKISGYIHNSPYILTILGGKYVVDLFSDVTMP